MVSIPDRKRAARFAKFLRRAVTASGLQKQEFAAQIGLSPQAFSQYLKGYQHSAPVEVCLRLAALTGTAEEKVLLLAGRADAAELLTRIFHVRGTPRDRALFKQWTQLEPPGIAERIITALLKVRLTTENLGLVERYINSLDASDLPPTSPPDDVEENNNNSNTH
jgi:transcriptional regulator with XRE-family HTH domain